MAKKVVIVGGGIGGLSAGVYARANGFEAVLLEKNASLGGECVSWKRKGYTIDGCINWLVGIRPGTAIHTVWEELGALSPEVAIERYDSYATAEAGGKTLTWWRDVARLKSELLALSPEDAPEIEGLCERIAAFQDLPVPADKPMDMFSLSDYIRFGKAYKPALPYIKEAGGITVKEYGKRFRTPLIGMAIGTMVPENYSMMSALVTLGMFASGASGYPAGGSQGVTDRIVSRFASLGGEARCNCEVAEILVERGRAAGVRLSSGETIRADYVVAALDAHTVLYGLLGGRLPDKKWDDLYAQPEKYRTQSMVRAAFGVNADLSARPRSLVIECRPYTLAGKRHHAVCFEHYLREPDFAPPGKTVVSCGTLTEDYEYFAALSPEDYRAEKQRYAETMAERLAEVYPETEGKIEMTDVTTPLTYHRWCGAYRGSFMAFCMTPEAGSVVRRGVVRGARGLYLASQWIQTPGGLPTAAAAGRFAVRRICKAEGVKFHGAAR